MGAVPAARIGHYVLVRCRGLGVGMDRVRWSTYGYSALVVGAAAIFGAAALASWQLGAAGMVAVALGVIVLRLRDVEPNARDDRFTEIMGSRVATIISVAGLIGLWVLSARRGGLWLVLPLVFTASGVRRLLQRRRTHAPGVR